MNVRRAIALWGGPLGFVLCLLLLPTGGEVNQAALAGTAWWMLWWWIGGGAPIGATSLLPIALFPLFGVMGIQEVAVPFGSKFIWLFLGGFVLALALERHGLHRRFALHLLRRIGGGPRRTLLGFMLATALLSMWISNTATTLMMLPMAMAVLALLEEESGPLPWGGALVLGVAYAANTGGMATLVGTPPNAALAGVASDRFGVEIGFAEWMGVGLPISAAVLTAVYFGLVRLHRFPGGKGQGATEAVVHRELGKLGVMGTAERRVMLLFAGTALLWIFRRPLNQILAPLDFALDDTSVAVSAAVACFAVRAPRSGDREGKEEALLAPEDLKRLPWDILLLFGGGLALAKGFESAGWAALLAEGAAGLGWSQWAMLVAVTGLGLFATELMSNLALTLLLTPVAGALAAGMGLHPLFFAAPVALASSGAFMLPMATPPNAIVFSSGRFRIADMVRTGIVFNVITLAIVLALWMVLAPEAWR
ncbi:MAG: anion transporter [Flavobacteriales bacterium]|nr:anion transporter [Flavobacteriales bacterium]